VDWESNFKKCCSIGMTPIAIENDYTKSCIDELAKRKFFFYSVKQQQNYLFVAPLWKFNTNYWTSGRMNRLNGSFLWCPSNSTFDNTSSLWGSGQPGFLNATGHCVHLSVSKTLGNVSITRKNCTNFYVLGCQVYH
jgi:hypothetical protein